jgi:hypothetical protein
MASYYQGNRDIKKEHYNMGVLLTEKKKKQILKEKLFLKRLMQIIGFWIINFVYTNH